MPNEQRTCWCAASWSAAIREGRLLRGNSGVRRYPDIIVEHAYIEPEAGFAVMDGDTLVITACTQAPYMDRDDTAKVLGLLPERYASCLRQQAAVSVPNWIFRCSLSSGLWR